MNNYPTLRQLQYLSALAETKNFRQAAEKCFVTQPTLSAAIQEMETLLGLPLLDRSNHKKVIFTDFGKTVLETSKNVFPLLNQMMSKASMMASPLSGPLRIGIIPTIAPYILPIILPALTKSFTNIDFKITEAMSHTLISALHEGQIDIALMAFPYDTGNLDYKVFYEEKFYCAAPPQTFTKKRINLGDLKDHNILLLEDGHCLRDHALSACKLNLKEQDQTLKATSLQTLIQMVAQGYGITLLPDMVVKSGNIPPDIDLIPFQNPAPNRQIGVTWRPKDPLLNNISAVTEQLKKSLKSSI
jgi:LysR family hydrogen peroxide-inducible transcriptional activator